MDDLIPAIDRYGWAVQLVTDDGPGHPAFGYTVGLAHQLPELLAIGVADPHAAGQLLNEVATQLRARPWLAQVGQPLAMRDGAPWPTVRLGAVAPICARRYARRDPLLLPILAPDGPAGRDELVAADHRDGGTWPSPRSRPWLTGAPWVPPSTRCRSPSRSAAPRTPRWCATSTSSASPP